MRHADRGRGIRRQIVGPAKAYDGIAVRVGGRAADHRHGGLGQPLRRLGRRHDLIARIVRDQNRLDPLRGGVGDDLDLPGDAVLRRRSKELQRRGVFQLLCGFLGPLAARDEVSVPLALGHHGDLHLLRRRGRGAGRHDAGAACRRATRGAGDRAPRTN